MDFFPVPWWPNNVLVSFVLEEKKQLGRNLSIAFRAQFNFGRAKLLLVLFGYGWREEKREREDEDNDTEEKRLDSAINKIDQSNK